MGWGWVRWGKQSKAGWGRAGKGRVGRGGEGWVGVGWDGVGWVGWDAVWSCGAENGRDGQAGTQETRTGSVLHKSTSKARVLPGSFTRGSRIRSRRSPAPVLKALRCVCACVHVCACVRVCANDGFSKARVFLLLPCSYCGQTWNRRAGSLGRIWRRTLHGPQLQPGKIQHARKMKE